MNPQTNPTNSGIPAPASPDQTPGALNPAAEAIGYLRVSTGRQAESGLGIEAQTTAIETWAHYNTSPSTG